MTAPLAFAMPGFRSFLPAAAQEATLEVGRFGDEELRVRVAGSVGGRDCIVVGAVSPPSDSLLALMLAAGSLKAHGARKVTALLPYLAYARSDIPEAGGVQSIGMIGHALDGAGVDGVVTVDVHSERSALLFPIPLVSLSPAPLLAEAIGRDWNLDVVVAPDTGAFPRARALADELGLDDPISAAQASGAVRALVVDDIIDTGATLSACCAELVERGVEEIVIAVTHGVFAGSHWQALLSLPVRALYTTDTIPGVRRDRPYLTRVVGVAPLIEGVFSAEAPAAAR